MSDLLNIASFTRAGQAGDAAVARGSFPAAIAVGTPIACVTGAIRHAIRVNRYHESLL